MNPKKIVLILLAVVLILMPLALAAPIFQPEGGGTLEGAWNVIKYIFGMQWMNDYMDFLAMMRLAIWLCLFTLIYAVLGKTGSPLADPSMKNARLMLAITIPSIAVMFTPTDVIVSMGMQFGIVLSIMLCLPVLILLLYIMIAAWASGKGLAIIGSGVLMYEFLRYFRGWEVAVYNYYTNGVAAQIRSANAGGLTMPAGTTIGFIMLPLMPFVFAYISKRLRNGT